MGTSDAQNLRSEAEILARQSRPQRSSTWIPKTRDWRYATGVIQHDDFEDAPKSRSVWDTLDYHYQAGTEIGSQRGSQSTSGAGSEVGIMDTLEVVPTPKGTVLRSSTASPRIAAPAKTTYKSMPLPKGAWGQFKRLMPSGGVNKDNGTPKYETTALLVRLYFTRKNKVLVKKILEQPAKPQTPLSMVNQNTTPPISSPNTPAAAPTAETMPSPHVLDSIESIYAFPLFKRPWIDETYDFNVATARSKIRPVDALHDDLGANYHWYTDAVPADAILPPGVPVSAKEISAFYPHHVRWKGIMIRLTNNDYRGSDIMGMQAHFRGTPDHHTPPVYMNNYQRDTVKTSVPGFKTVGYKGKSDRNLLTDHLVPGPYIESTSKGRTLPSFEDLVRGLQRLPSGLDARGLTQCLSWYLNIRDTFTPKLEMNVLHTQSLIRALREPLKPYGPQNLDRNALEEWRSKGTFETVDIEDKKHQKQSTTAEAGRQGRSQLHLKLDEDDVSMKFTLPLRHILTFPFLALHGVVGEALKLGIEKTEKRQAGEEEEEANKGALEAKWAAKAAEKDNVEMTEAEQDDTAMQPLLEEHSGPYRTPKRPLPVDTDMLSAHKKPNIPIGHRNPTVPRKPAPASLRSLAAAPPLDAGYLSLSWNSPAPSSTYAPQQQNQGNVYGRRDFQARQQNQHNGRAYQPGAAYGRGAPYPPGYDNGQDGWR